MSAPAAHTAKLMVMPRELLEDAAPFIAADPLHTILPVLASVGMVLTRMSGR